MLLADGTEYIPSTGWTAFYGAVLLLIGAGYKIIALYKEARTTKTSTDTDARDARIASDAKEAHSLTQAKSESQALDHDYYQRIFDDIRAEASKMTVRMDTMRDENVKSLMAAKDETNACEKRFVKMEAELGGEIKLLTAQVTALTERLGRYERANGNGH